MEKFIPVTQFRSVGSIGKPAWLLFTQKALTAVVLAFAALTGWSQTRTATFSTAGTYTWTAPCDVTSVTVQAWGGGGGGGFGRQNSGAAGGGGGGGAFATSAVTVVPGNTYTIVVGYGGFGGINNIFPSEAGAGSSFNGTSVVAAGGSPGNGSSSNSAAAPGLGGTVAASTGTTRFAGGRGATGIAGTGGSAGGGGGGGSAGTAVAGNFTAATISVPGAGAVAGGGAGGNGAYNSDGGNGVAPGGGGAGGHRQGGGNEQGGDGADGRVVLTFNSAFNAYCTSVPTNSGLNDGIARVIFNTIDNTTTTNAGTEYADFGCTHNTNVERGLTYPLSVYVNTGGNNTRNQRAWADWNQDGDFDDAGESFTLATVNNVTNGLVTVSVPVPAGATLGTTKLRITSSSRNTPNSCDNLNFSGQVEDYKITVIAATNCTGTPSAGSISISAATGAPSSTFTLTATGYTIGTGITYQWQISNTGVGGWTNIAGATTVPSQVVTAVNTPSTVRYYRLLVTCTPSSSNANSGNVTYTTTTNTIYNIPTNGTTTTVPCGTNAILYDNGGLGGNYSNNANGYIYLQNSGSSVITITGTYNLRPDDYLIIYNGTGTYTAVNQTWYSTTTPTSNAYTNSTTGVVNYTSAPGQPLTIRFTSDNSSVRPGFELFVSYSGNCSATPVYCVAPNMGISGVGFYLKNVQFVGTLNNVTNNSTYSNNGYQDFTALPQAVQEDGEGINVKYTIDVRAQVKAWVDWNKNNVFDEPSETIYDPSGVLTGSGTFGFIIPSGTAPGSYRLRIRTSNNYDVSSSGGGYPSGYPTISPCNRLFTGETEDYLFTVIPRCNARVASVTGQYRCSNTDTTFTLSVTGFTGVTGFNWYAAETGGTALPGSTFIPGAPPTGTFTTPAISNTTTYWVAAVDAGCETPTRVPVVAEIRTIPDISFQPGGSPSLCEGAAISVSGGTSTPETVVLINEGFEGTGLGSFTVSTPTATPSAANMQWQSKTSTFTPTNTTVWRPAISSGFGTNKFAYATSDLANGLVETNLNSPSVNTTSFTSLTLSFKVYYSHYLSDLDDGIDDYFDILTSTNGVNYTYLPAHSPTGDNSHKDLGEGTSFTTLTYDMSAFIGNPNFSIRFAYYGAWVDGIAIDSIRLFGTKPTTSNFTWQQLDAITMAPVLPINNLYTNLAPPTLYVSGNPAANVYVQPTPAQQAAGDPLPFIASLNLTNGCTIKDTIKVYIDSKVWLGNTSNWNLASNWCGSVLPTLNDRVRIPISPTGGNMPVISASNTGQVRSLTIDNGASVTVDNGGTLEVRLDLNTQSGGTFTNNGTLKLVGNDVGIAQNFPGIGTVPAMNIVEIDNTGGGATLNKDITISRELKPTRGILNLANNNIIIASNATRTASVSAVGATAGFNYGAGRFIVERYLSFPRKWQLLSVPAKSTQSIFSSWQDGGSSSVTPTGYGVQITGPGPITGTGLDAVTTAASMKVQSGTSILFTGVTQTNTAGSLANARGYYLYVYGNRSSGATVNNPTPTTLRTTGRLFVGKTGDTDEPPAINVAAAFGDNVSVGNPFASAINFNSLFVGAGGTIANNYKVWDASQGGTYASGIYQTISGTAGGLATPGSGSIYNVPGDYRDIQSGQAFYVQANSNVNIPFAENVKSSVHRLANRGGEGGSENVDPFSISMISAMLHTGSGQLLDGNRVVLDDIYSGSVDGNDAIKLMNDGINFAISKQPKNLVVEGRSTLAAADTIQYHMTNIFAGQYQLRLAVQNINEPLLQAEMVDRFTNARTLVSLTDSSFINFTVTADAASRAANRFYLVFKTIGIVPVNFVSINAARQPDRSIAVSWQVANEVNIVRYEVERSANGSSFNGILQADAAGANTYNKTDIAPLANDNFYRIKAIGLAGDITYSPVVKVAAEKELPVIAVNPNPVKDKLLSIRFVKQEAGRYSLQLSNALGQLLYNGTVTVNTNAEVKSIPLHPRIATGTYQLTVRNKEGVIVHSQNIIVE